MTWESRFNRQMRLPPAEKRHWERSGIVDVEVANHLSEGSEVWFDWQRTICPDNTTAIRALEADAGRYLGYARVIGRRRPETKLDDPIVSIPSHYVQKPLLRVAKSVSETSSNA